MTQMTACLVNSQSTEPSGIGRKCARWDRKACRFRWQLALSCGPLVCFFFQIVVCFFFSNGGKKRRFKTLGTWLDKQWHSAKCYQTIFLGFRTHTHTNTHVFLYYLTFSNNIPVSAILRRTFSSTTCRSAPTQFASNPRLALTVLLQLLSVLLLLQSSSLLLLLLLSRVAEP